MNGREHILRGDQGTKSDEVAVSMPFTGASVACICTAEGRIALLNLILTAVPSEVMLREWTLLADRGNYVIAVTMSLQVQFLSDQAVLSSLLMPGAYAAIDTL